MSPRKSSSRPGGPYRKPQADIYTVLLAIALVALIIGIICLCLEMNLYEFKLKGGPTVSAAAPPSTVVAKPWMRTGRLTAEVAAAGRGFTHRWRPSTTCA